MNLYTGRVLRFEVHGTPRPQGSLTAWRTAAGSKVRIAHAGGVPFRRWRSALTNAAILATTDVRPFEGPVVVTLTFRVPRPSKERRAYATGPPDIDKLARAVLDAMSGVVYPDDAQVIALMVTKHWGTPDDPPGVRCTVEEVTP